MLIDRRSFRRVSCSDWLPPAAAAASARRFGRFGLAGMILLGSLFGAFGAFGTAVAQEQTAPGNSAAPKDSTDRDDSAGPDKPSVPPGRATYMGRRIAQTMHFTGAEWLIRDEREREERCSLMLANLGIKPGMMVCDMGCGNGFYSLQMARMTGGKGRVLAVDIQPQMLYLLRQRMEKEGVENVTPILGSLHDPRLPSGIVDLILLVDVYHEFSHPEHMLRAMRESLAPGGLIVLVEYRQEDPEVPIKPLHKMSREQIMKELPANGFKLVKEFDKLPWQHMMFFGRDDS